LRPNNHALKNVAVRKHAGGQDPHRAVAPVKKNRPRPLPSQSFAIRNLAIRRYAVQLLTASCTITHREGNCAGQHYSVKDEIGSIGQYSSGILWNLTFHIYIYIYIYIYKVKLSPKQSVEAYRVVRC
jgi:hypothetical protein